MLIYLCTYNWNVFTNKISKQNVVILSVLWPPQHNLSFLVRRCYVQFVQYLIPGIQSILKQSFTKIGIVVSEIVN